MLFLIGSDEIIVDSIIQMLWNFDITSLPGIRSMSDPLMMLFLISGAIERVVPDRL